jgi:alpha-ketoglutarate-dependent taurine dioxygenase
MLVVPSCRRWPADTLGRVNITQFVDRAEPVPGSEPALPFVITAATEGTRVTAFLTVARDTVRQRMYEHGAVLLRGFDVGDGFDRVVRAVSGAAPTYLESSASPEEEVFPRNEGSDRATWPETVFLRCLRPAATRGATLLADTRRVLRTVDAGVREEFAARGWLAGRTRRRAVHIHPVTGEAVWFNDVTAHPHYGDGEAVPNDVRTHLLGCYRAAQRRVAWQPDDVLVVDNMLTARGREPFTGRRLVVAAVPAR